MSLLNHAAEWIPLSHKMVIALEKFPVAIEFQDREFNKTQNLVLESATEPHFPKSKIWF
jgi:hypothetical protein